LFIQYSFRSYRETRSQTPSPEATARGSQRETPEREATPSAEDKATGASLVKPLEK